MLQKYSAERPGQPALEISPSAGFPPREARVEAESHISGPHTLLFWENQSLPTGRGGFGPGSSCWRTFGPRRKRVALPPTHTFIHWLCDRLFCSVTLQAPGPALGIGLRAPGGSALPTGCEIAGPSVPARYDGDRPEAGSLCWDDAKGRCRRGRCRARRSPGPTCRPNWALATGFCRVTCGLSRTGRWVPLRRL